MKIKYKSQLHNIALFVIKKTILTINVIIFFFFHFFSNVENQYIGR